MYTAISACVEVRRQFLRFGSLFLLWALGTDLRSFWPDSKFLLSHLASPLY